MHLWKSDLIINGAELLHRCPGWEVKIWKWVYHETFNGTQIFWTVFNRNIYLCLIMHVFICEIERENPLIRPAALQRIESPDLIMTRITDNNEMIPWKNNIFFSLHTQTHNVVQLCSLHLRLLQQSLRTSRGWTLQCIINNHTDAPLGYYLAACVYPLWKPFVSPHLTSGNVS